MKIILMLFLYDHVLACHLLTIATIPLMHPITIFTCHGYHFASFFFPLFSFLFYFFSGDALATLFSALYGKLLVVMGIAFPMAEVISTYIPPSFYEVSSFS